MPSLMIELVGETVGLDPDGALWWPGSATLFVADLHLGKGAVFRSRGIPVPTGSSSKTLKMLSVAIGRYPAKRVVILGDLLHARESRGAQLINEIVAWRREHQDLAIMLVPGNHDRTAQTDAREVEMEFLEEGSPMGPFRLLHNPPKDDSAEPWLAGHLHPTVRLKGRAAERMRMRCFWHRGNGLVLPAMGVFTGGMDVEPQEGDCLYICAGDRVLPIRG